MKHSAKKTEYKGTYEYRGFIIENNGECWTIGKGTPTSNTTLDAMNTKKDAMAKVDTWLN